MARALDHYVLQVRDLAAAGGVYERLGFQVLPRMQHIEIGTSNRVVQFANTYLELFGDLDGVEHPILDEYLPRFDCGDGVSHVSLNSSNLEEDHRAIDALGLDPRPVMSARRKVDMPDGTIDETASSFFYLWRPERLYLSLFLSEHKKPHTIFIPEYRVHPNTAIDTIGVTFVSDDPALDRAYFTALYAAEPHHDSAQELAFRGARGDFARVLSRTRAEAEFKNVAFRACEKLKGYPMALTFSVGSIEVCEQELERRGVPYVIEADVLRIGAEEAHGAVLEFVEEGAL